MERRVSLVRKAAEEKRMLRERFENAELMGSLDIFARELEVETQVVVLMLGGLKMSREETEKAVAAAKRQGIRLTSKLLMMAMYDTPPLPPEALATMQGGEIYPDQETL